MSPSDISRCEWCRALRWDSSPIPSAKEKDVMPLRQVASDSAAPEQRQLCDSSALYVQRASQSSALCACLKYPGGCTTSQVKAVEATAHPRDLHPGPCTCVAGVMALQLTHLCILRLPLRSQLDGLQPLDTLGFEPRAFRMRSGCDTTTPCALEWHGHRCHFRTSLGASGVEHCAGIRTQGLPYAKRM